MQGLGEMQWGCRRGGDQENLKGVREQTHIQAFKGKEGKSNFLQTLREAESVEPQKSLKVAGLRSSWEEWTQHVRTGTDLFTTPLLYGPGPSHL